MINPTNTSPDSGSPEADETQDFASADKEAARKHRILHPEEYSDLSEADAKRLAKIETQAKRYSKSAEEGVDEERRPNDTAAHYNYRHRFNPCVTNARAGA